MNWKALLGGLAVLWLIALTWALVSLGGQEDGESSEGGEAGAGVARAGGQDREAPVDGASSLASAEHAERAGSGENGAEADGNVASPEGVGETAPPDSNGGEPPVEDGPGAFDGAPASEGDPAGEDQDPGELAESGELDAYQRKVLREIFDPLEEAAKRYDRHDELDERSLFGADQKSNQKAIDALLDEAIEILGVSEVGSVREEIRKLEARITEAEQRLSRDREARLSAPYESELNAIEKTLTTSREDYEERIEENETLVADTELAIVELKQQFRQELRDIGVELSPEAVEGLLTTVSGDDFVEMCVVFDNVRNVTVQLQELTEEAGEALEVARRYYGSYVVLVRIMDRLQKEFVRRVSDEQLPRLKEFQAKARENIAQAQRNLSKGGDPEIAKANIRSNQLTIDACELYSEYLVEQARDVTAQNDALQTRLRDAINTYETVQLSSQVAELLAEGRRNFSALLELDLPELRGFENAELQAEFQRLTRELVQP
jgi:hypothetical protein